MSSKDIADLFIEATSRIEFYWHFYAVFVIALIGWLVTTSKPFTKQLKLLITFAYIAFVLMNMLGLHSTMMLTEALREDLVGRGDVETSMNLTHGILKGMSYDTQRYLMYLLHPMFGAAVLLVIWRGRFGTPVQQEPADAC